MSEVQGKIIKAWEDETKSGDVIYRVTFKTDSGKTVKAVTFDEEIFAEAEEFVRKPATIEYNVSKKGRFTNVYFEGISAPDPGADENDDDEDEPAEEKPRSRKAPAARDGNDKDRELRIMRQSTLGYAATLGGSLADVFAKAQLMLAYVQTGQVPEFEEDGDPLDEDEIPY